MGALSGSWEAVACPPTPPPTRDGEPCACMADEEQEGKAGEQKGGSQSVYDLNFLIA